MRRDAGRLGRRRQCVAIVDRRQDVDAAMTAEGLGNGEPFPRRMRIAHPTLPGHQPHAGGPQQRLAIAGKVEIGRTGAIPFEHREFRRMGRAALGIAKAMRSTRSRRQAARPKRSFFIANSGGRGMEESAARSPRPGLGSRQAGRLKRAQMRLEPGTHLQGRGLDLDEAGQRRSRAWPSVHGLGFPNKQGRRRVKLSVPPSPVRHADHPFH